VSDVTLYDRWVTTAKPHRCDMCNGPVPEGDRAHYASGQWNGEFYSGWQHPECWESFVASDCEEYMCGDFPVPLRILKVMENSKKGESK
jgi:hypothetical protein